MNGDVREIQTYDAFMTKRLALTAALLALTFAACTDEPSVASTIEGDLERACHEIADRVCCGLTDGELVNCHRDAKFSVCYGPVGSAPEAGCMNGGRCIRSNVDFDACHTALDALFGETCPTHLTSADLPAECFTKECPTAESGCAEDPEPWSGLS